MSKKEDKKEDTRVLAVRYRFDASGKVHFINPSTDEMPIDLFCAVMAKISEVAKEWNAEVEKDNRVDENN